MQLMCQSMMYSAKLQIASASILFLGIATQLALLPPVVAYSGGSGSNGGSNAAPLDATSAPDHPNLRAKSLILVKVWCLIIAFVATFLAGVSPYYYRWNAAFLVLGTQFAGGIFLATAFIHFLSDSNSSFQLHTNKTYPFAFMLATAGYLLTMLGDCIISWVYLRSTGSSKLPATKEDQELGTKRVADTESQIAANPVVCGEHGAAACNCQDVTEDSQGKNMVTAIIVTQSSWGDALLLILALCFHSVFEGIAIGVAETQHDAWRNLWTVSLHKIFAAIAMGIALLRILPNRPLLSCSLYSFAFAISTPIGVAIGILIDSTSQGAIADWIYAVSMGIAAGVFIYVAINHLLAKGYIPQTKVVVDTPFIKLIAVTLGAGLMAVVLIWD
ncbi:hypothetical protein O6H91_05G068900 [Diphasiastrum complanatum]|uniref:Uncharacterized protein n=1 Tax=Diphasiastrum complanatum TaxID=34168 RepID=A0ACC2DPA8_DIPCM|nr:hypothetical protein O6H91_05G068900 [Diphasiastrum complanatum]